MLDFFQRVGMRDDVPSRTEFSVRSSGFTFCSTMSTLGLVFWIAGQSRDPRADSAKVHRLY